LVAFRVESAPALFGVKPLTGIRLFWQRLGVSRVDRRQAD
jgi:hypothetical protein